MSTPEAQLRAERVEASVMRGIGYARRNQWQQALRALTAALEEDPQHIEAHYQLAICQAQVGNAREGSRLLRRALSFPQLRDADKLRLLRTLGRIGIQVGDYPLAADCFEAALDMTGDTGGPIFDQLAQVMCKSGQFKRGLDLYLRALQSRKPTESL